MTEPQQPEIRELDDRTIERIAAGEVVERPASVVKELLENSIDADASRVTVAVEAGGTDSIRVADDGVGMSESALRRAVEKHTTSKIGDIEDLERGVATLGFRGEALHAIGAVSRLRIASRPRGGGPGTELTVEGGEVTEVSPAGCPEGTTVEVWDLFYNVPARRKYLKQEATEFTHVNRVTTSYALANPGVAVTLEHDGRETFATTGQGNLQETVLSVYGREVAGNMVEIGADDLPEGPLAGITGLVSKPETNRASREYLSTFVNGRYVTAGTVRDAIVDAYGTQLAGDRYPFAVVFLEVDPGTIDVNIHPRKLDVRFADEEGVREQVRTAVEETLLSDGFLRSSAPRGRSAPEQTEIQPDSGRHDGATTATEDAKAETGDQDAGSSPDSAGAADRDAGSSPDSAGAADRDADSSPDRAEKRSGPTITNRTVDAEAYPEGAEKWDAEASSPGGSQRSGRDTGGQSNDLDGHSRSGEQAKESRPTGSNTGSQSAPSNTGSQPAPSNTGSRSRGDDGQATSGPSAGESGGGRKFRDTGTQQRLGGSGHAGTREGVALDSLPSMRVLGQFDDTYIVAEADDGLVLVDQHAADERINYERLQEQFDGDTTTQALADPVELELTAGEAAVFDAASDALAQLGFHADRVGDRTVRVSTIPAVVADTAGPELIREVLTDLVADGGTAEETVEAVADGLLSDMACHPSITGNTSLTDGSVVDLLSTLDSCDNPWACPHGRPVVIHVDSGEIEDRFERDYPGHGD